MKRGTPKFEVLDTIVRFLLEGRSEDGVLAALEKTLNVTTTVWDEIFKCEEGALIDESDKKDFVKVQANMDKEKEVKMTVRCQ